MSSLKGSVPKGSRKRTAREGVKGGAEVGEDVEAGESAQHSADGDGRAGEGQEQADEAAGDADEQADGKGAARFRAGERQVHDCLRRSGQRKQRGRDESRQAEQGTDAPAEGIVQQFDLVAAGGQGDGAEGAVGAQDGGRGGVDAGCPARIVRMGEAEQGGAGGFDLDGDALRREGGDGG